MSDYNLQVSWSGKDALSDSDADKVISGDDFHTEFTAVKTAVDTKADIASETFTGTPLAPTAAVGTDSTQIATTAFVKNVLETYIYPVGSIYMNMAVATNPGTLLGFGTWVAYATGQALVGYEASGTFDALDESLGAETFSGTSGSTAADLAAHSHKVAGGEHATGSYDNGDNWQVGNLSSVSTARAYQVDTSSAGSGGGHTDTIAGSTLQPSVTVHMWKRTA